MTAPGSGPSPSSFVKLRMRGASDSARPATLNAHLSLALILSLTKDEGGPNPVAV